MGASMAEITVGALVGRAAGDAPLGAIAALAEPRREVDRREASVVRRARVPGVSWAVRPAEAQLS